MAAPFAPYYWKKKLTTCEDCGMACTMIYCGFCREAALVKHLKGRTAELLFGWLR